MKPCTTKIQYLKVIALRLLPVSWKISKRYQKQSTGVENKEAALTSKNTSICYGYLDVQTSTPSLDQIEYFFNQCEIKRLAKKRSSLKHDKLHKFFIQCELFCIQFELHQAPYTISSMRKAFSKFLWQNKASRTTIRCVIELTELIAASSSKFMRASRYVQNWRHSNK